MPSGCQHPGLNAGNVSRTDQAVPALRATGPAAPGPFFLATLLPPDGNAVGINARLLLISATIAGGLGFTGIAGVGTSIAHILLVLFLILFVVSLIFARR